MGANLAGVAGELGTIVVIEDDPHISDLVDMYLRREGYRVIQASDGESGLAAIAREQPRLVILDVGLPGTSTASTCAGDCALRPKCPS